MSKQFMAVLAAVVVGLGLVFWVSSSSKSDNKGSNSSNTQPTNHVIGQGKKKVTLIEYGDYQCPVCGSFHPVLKQLIDQYSQEIYFQFRNLPLTQIHQNAVAAARAAEAAGLQNKYFEMHDLLYDQQTVWSSSSNPLSIFQSYAQQLKLDMTKFNADYSSAAVNDLVQADLTEYAKTGKEQSTPSFFLNGKHLNNTDLIDDRGPSFEKFSAVIKAEIEAQK